MVFVDMHWVSLEQVFFLYKIFFFKFEKVEFYKKRIEREIFFLLAHCSNGLYGQSWNVQNWKAGAPMWLLWGAKGKAVEPSSTYFSGAPAILKFNNGDLNWHPHEMQVRMWWISLKHHNTCPGSKFVKTKFTFQIRCL